MAVPARCPTLRLRLPLRRSEVRGAADTVRPLPSPARVVSTKLVCATAAAAAAGRCVQAAVAALGWGSLSSYAGHQSSWWSQFPACVVEVIWCDLRVLWVGGWRSPPIWPRHACKFSPSDGISTCATPRESGVMHTPTQDSSPRHKSNEHHLRLCRCTHPKTPRKHLMSHTTRVGSV